MKLSKHFDIWQGVDFVRGMSDEASSLTVATHLSSGCTRCEGLVRVLREFAHRAALDASCEPPPNIVRRAEAIFPQRQPEKTFLGHLVYDSFREPLPAGMRAEDRQARHALYEAGDLFVDLQLEHQPGSGTVTLVGQISDREKPRANTTTLPVLLMSGRGLVASAMCNRLGEFELAYKPARDLRLYVPLRETGGHFELRMDELVAQASDRGQPAAPAARRRTQTPKRPAR
jgi:hypothetical protein